MLVSQCEIDLLWCNSAEPDIGRSASSNLYDLSLPVWNMPNPCSIKMWYTVGFEIAVW